MKTLILFAFLSLLASCTKSGSDNNTNPTPAPDITTDTTARVWLEPVNFANGWDTTNNYIGTYSFYKGGAGTLLNQYIASNSSGTHRLRYVGSVPFFHVDSVRSRGGQLIEFPMSRELRGKPIFEIYDIATGQLYKRYIANKDSVRIIANFSSWDNYTTPNKKIADAMLYYINVKQNDGIRYRKD